MNRRLTLQALLAGAVAPSLSWVASSPPGSGWASVRAFGARGDGRSDDSEAFQAALDRALKVWVPAGRYVVGDLAIRSHTRIAGEGERSVLVHRPKSTFLAAVNPGNLGSPDPRDNSRAIAIEGLAFVGRGAREGFREHIHLLTVHACTDLTVSRCSFRAFQGDAIYLGSGAGAGVERHNQDIAIRGCFFDGIDYANRQCVSVIDGTRVTIEGNEFRNCSRFDMPGAVDIEPDENRHHVIRDIRVVRNRFINVQGMVGAVCVILPIPHFDVPPRGILIADNHIEGRFRTPGVVVKAFVDARNAPPLDLVVTGNRILQTIHGFEFSGVRGVRFERNLVRHTSTEPVLSLPRRGRCAEVVLRENRFEHLAMNTGGGIRVHPTSALRIERNRFVDCGPVGGPPAAALVLDEPPDAQSSIAKNTYTHCNAP